MQFTFPKLRFPRFWRWRPGKKARIVLWGFAVLLVAGVYKSYASPPVGPQGVVMSPDETAYTSRIIDSGIRMLAGVREQVGDGLYRRDAHAKGHACLVADFTVKKGLDPKLSQGVFAEPKTYKAWVRYSSGSEQLRSDWLPDARGMAIKLLGVPGKKLLEGEQDARTQDFLMINNPAFFIQDVKKYAEFTSFQAAGKQFGYFFNPTWNPFEWKLREFRIGTNILKWPPRHLLADQYYSMTAYKLGATNNMKYSAKAVSCDGKSKVSNSWASFGSAALQTDLEAQIKKNRACFDFMVQLQVLDKNMPVEDTTVQWDEDDSPFITVARVELGVQDVAPNMANNFCENLSMTPWHALPEHEPIGGLNRVRKAVYQGIQRYRRCSNGIAFGEPREDGSRQLEMGSCNPGLQVPLVTSGSAP